MAKFFTRERFGTPQFAAGFLLLIFLAQCLWLVYINPISGSEIARIQRGLDQWRNGQINIEDPYRSPLYYLVGSFALFSWHGPVDTQSLQPWRWLVRAPWICFGVLLGASLWYVARRLYGNAGGYIALLLYCFSPVIIAQSASYGVQPEIGAAWGTFGAVFTSIAVAHTLYAPRRVLWNWRRIALLGLSLALAVGSQFSLWVVLLIALGFLLYLAPGRRGAALAIFAASCAAALVVLWAGYSLSAAAFLESIRHARLLDFTPRALLMAANYRRLGQVIVRASPALIVLVPLALVTFSVWRRARYFGNSAPVIVSGLLLFLGLLNPHQPGLGFVLMTIPILFVFISGVLADLLETGARNQVFALASGLLAANTLWSLGHLPR